MQAGRLRSGDESDRAVETVVVGYGQPAQSKRDRPLDEVVRGRRPVEEREVGVAMEFSVWDLRHGSLRLGAGLRGQTNIEQTFTSRHSQ